MEMENKSQRREQPVQDRIIHIADVHFWQLLRNPFRMLSKRFLGNLNVWLRRRHEFLMEKIEPYAEEVLSTGAKFALFTGDFTSTALEEEFALARDFVQRLSARGMRVAVLPGNHDVYTFRSHRQRRFEEYFAEFIPPEGYPARITLPGGTPLVLIPTVCPNFLWSRGHIDAAAIGQVQDLIADCQGPVVAAAHYPVLAKTPGYATSWQRRLQNAAKLRGALAATGKRILFAAGHVHRFSYIKDPDHPTLTHLTTGAFIGRSEKRGTNGEFSEIRAIGDHCEVIHHSEENGWKRRTALPASIRQTHC